MRLFLMRYNCEFRRMYFTGLFIKEKYRGYFSRFFNQVGFVGWVKLQQPC